MNRIFKFGPDHASIYKYIYLNNSYQLRIYRLYPVQLRHGTEHITYTNNEMDPFNFKVPFTFLLKKILLISHAC